MLREQIILAQLSVCKIALKKYREAEELLSREVGNGGEHFRYYLGVNFAAQGKYEEALSEFVHVINNDPQNQTVKNMAFKLLLMKAQKKAVEKNYGDMLPALNMALEFAPDTPEAQRGLSYFMQFHPLIYLMSGKREKAAELWEAEFKKQPTDYKIIHNLALLYYWWARSEEQQIANSSGSDRSNNVCSLWQKCISYWIMLFKMELFWTEWKKEKENIWHLSIDPDDLRGIGELFLEEKLVKLFNEYIDFYKQAGRNKDSVRHENYLLSLLFEKEAAIKWEDAYEDIEDWVDMLDITLDGIRRYDFVRAMQKAEGTTACFGTVKYSCVNSNTCIWKDTCLEGRNRSLYFNIIAGQQFFLNAEMLVEVNKLLELMHKDQPDDESIGELRVYFHPGGLGRVLFLLDHGNNPHQAVSELERLSDTKSVDRNSLDVKYMRILSYLKRGEYSYKNGKQLDAALEDWAFAKDLILEVKESISNDEITYFRQSRTSLLQLIGSLNKDVEQAIADSCEKEAIKYKKANKVDDAIAVLQKAVKLVNRNDNDSLFDHIALFYCDRGGNKLSLERFADARKDFEEALKYVPEYVRAQEGLSTTYNNEGVSKDNDDQAIPLFEKALELNNKNHVAKENLAGAYNRKGIACLNAITQNLPRAAAVDLCGKAIVVLRKAVLVQNPSLTDKFDGKTKTIDWIENSGDRIKEYTKNMDESLYKSTLHNLSAAGDYRKHLRGF